MVVVLYCMYNLIDCVNIKKILMEFIISMISLEYVFNSLLLVEKLWKVEIKFLNCVLVL